jgi:hypothetical protein
MNPFLIRMLLKRRKDPLPHSQASRDLGRVYGAALALIALLIVVIAVLELARTHGGAP